MLAIFKRELKSYLYSPIAYILIGFFIFLTSIFFLSPFSAGVAEFNSTLSTMGFILMFIVPILTMRIMAEDRKNGTEVLLITSPESITGIVAGKFLAILSVFGVMVLITTIYPMIMFMFGNPYPAQLLGGYAGFILLGSTFIAIGMFASSLTENQVVAAVISFALLITMWIMDFISRLAGGIFAKFLSWFSLLSRYDGFNRGIFDLSSIVYYLSFIAVFLFLTVRVIEKRRWSQG